ncbi:MAG: phosphotransferase, partial [Desulfovibrio sp.]|nr:phosphotransferase [Desulfovibrio sp.]
MAYLSSTGLDDLVSAAGTDFNSDGVGKFIKFVIQDYFQSVPLMDKRAMVSAGLRYAPPNATSMQQLGAMLKGAGPVLQKIFQGLDGPGLPKDLRIACQDMKSRLAPIPPDIVEAHLLDMVNSSNGRITNIEVLSSLGAASVGQAFLCRLTDRNGQSRECVVKILRPDVANRVRREQPIFEKAAAKVPGMLGTFRGQMEGIMEELDFGIETQNAKSAVVYNKPYDGAEHSIQSVKVVEDIPSKSTSMAMELAPGTTLDSFTRNTRDEIERMGQNLGRTESFNAQGQRTKVSYDVPQSRLNELAPVKARLQQLYDEAKARHLQLTALADVWVTEGIFGEEGFFHGDLHAGNIMSDGKKLTVIDFGNATKLSTEQQCAVTTMIVATTTRQSSKFLDAF